MCAMDQRIILLPADLASMTIFDIDINQYMVIPITNSSKPHVQLRVDGESGASSIRRN
jgi:hypothetical protein